MTDCTFERGACELFQPSSFPLLVLITKEKVYRMHNLKQVLDKEDILEYLSGDNYIEMSEVW